MPSRLQIVSIALTSRVSVIFRANNKIARETRPIILDQSRIHGLHQHRVSRRTFLVSAPVVVGTLGLATQFDTPTADAQPAAGLALLSDFEGAVPPTQITVKCTVPGTFAVSWSPGSIPSGSMRCNVYLDGVLVATSWGVSATIAGVDTTGVHNVEVATLTADNVESERSSGVIRTAVPDDDSGSIPAALFALRSFGGVQLRWVHAGPNRDRQPAQYIVRSTTDASPLAVLQGDATSCFVTGLPVGIESELILESLDTAGAVIAEARNRVRVTPYSRALLNDYSAPTVPTGVSAVSGRSALRVSWTASADSGSGVLGYKVYANQLFRGQVEGATTLVIAGLQNAVTHRVTVSSYDRAGNESAQSAQTNAIPYYSSPVMQPPAQPIYFKSQKNKIIDPAGLTYVPIGANLNGPSFLWNDDTRGRSAAAADLWKWTCVRLSTGNRDYESPQGYTYFNNNQLDAIVSEYTAKKIVVMIAQHSAVGGGGAGSNLPTAAGSSGDPSGRSSEQASIDWWVEVAKRYRDNPYVWFNLINEPGPNQAELDAQYRRMLARVRAVAPRSTIVLDAASFANDIPTSTTIGTGALSEVDSYVLSRGPAIAADLGPSKGYGPIVFSVHLYARWAVNWGGTGSTRLTDAEFGSRLRDYCQRVAAKSLPLLIGEIGVEAYAFDADSLCVKAGLYEQGSVVRNGVTTTTGVLVEQGVGVLAWHAARTSGMSVAKPSANWWAADTRDKANPPPHAGEGLWDYAHLA